MSTVDDTEWTDDDLDTALEELLFAGLLPAVRDLPRMGQSGRSRPRWVAPLAAAATVAAIGIGAVLVGSEADRRADLRAATTVTVTDRVADVGGIRFPLPDGWSVAVVQSSDIVVTACAAAVPANPCDGVTVSIAVDDGQPLPNSVEDPVLGSNCGGNGGFVRVETDVTLGGRPANHYFGGGCTADAPPAHLWVLLDLSLAMTTPIGRWSDEIDYVAGGLDLSSWGHRGGDQQIFFTEATAPTR